MSIYEAIGMVWVIFTSALASIEIVYLAIVGLRSLMKQQEQRRATEHPLEVSEMFKVVR
jgi:hypothetical protein